MITDAKPRIVLAWKRIADAQIELLRFDSRWRSTRSFMACADKLSGYTHLDVLEGNYHFAVIERGENTGLRITLRSVDHPDLCTATGEFQSGNWHFSGEHQQWANVPEYLLVREKFSYSVLRIADDATTIDLDGIDDALGVIAVPNSRLLVISRIGGMSIFDVYAKRVIHTYRFKEHNPTPTIRFRGEELWANDVTTMLKLDAKFAVIDAAGSELETEHDPTHGAISSWTFAAGAELCLVTRPDMHDVVVLDTVTMLPVAHAVFPAWSRPKEAVLCGTRTVIGQLEDGSLVCQRLRRVRFQ